MTSAQPDSSASQANDPQRDLARPPLAKSLNASGDPLTGLASRAQFTDFLAGSLRMHGVSEDSFAVVLLDIDRFRDMNDRVGPAVCEKLLCLMAQRLRAIGRSASLIGRTSGDGFGLIVRDASVAVEFAEMLLSFLTRPFAVDGHAVTLGVSIGVAKAGLHGREALELLHAAKLAVHEAKRSGGSRVRMFDPAMLAIRDMGVAISLDDFGVGHSSLGRLCQHPFNRIKIDRSIVSRLDEAAPSDAWNAGESMIRAVVSLGKALNMKTICEGVETVDQLRIAKRAGCAEVQGYLIGRPCLAQDVAGAVQRLGPASLREWIGHE